MTVMEYSLRPASGDDFEFLFRLRAAALGPYVAQIWGWNEDDQRRRFASAFDPSRYQIVQVLGEDIGAIEVDRGAREIAIANIELLPVWQGRGVGTALLRSALADADAANLAVSLQVFKINPARRLYERLGFVVVGETATHYQMRRAVSDYRRPEG
jgi:ribosomal protein S18 acetylase RimI-like enzyme